MPDSETPRSPLVTRLAAVRKGRSTHEVVTDLARLGRRHGVRGVTYRASYELSRVLAPPEPPGPQIDRTATVPFGVAAAPYFNPDQATLDANRAVVERFARRGPEVHTATWFVPYFEHVLFGGISTILRFMNYLTVNHGVEHRIVLFDSTTATDAALRSELRGEFPALADVDIVLPEPGHAPFSDFEELPFTDIAVCTIWHSAYALARFNATDAKYYFVQDYEPLFYPAGTLYALSEATYRFGFAGLVNTPGLETIYASYGNPATSFVPAVEQLSGEEEKPSSRPGAPVQIVLYGRPQTDRNGFELLAEASRRVKERFGNQVRIVSAGEEFDPGEYRLNGIVENAGLLRSRAEIHDLYTRSDVGVCCMFSKHPSYQPFEYLAARAAVVTNANSATSWFLRDGENSLVAEPFPIAIAEAIGRLVTDRELRLKLAARGFADVTSVEWDTEFAKLWHFITGETNPPEELPT
ncbi:MAG: glycosyltransferase family 4 protein [Acidimicrobiales bacterium]|jgi:glycosyltransferase involved in cell wall biosynthesis